MLLKAKKLYQAALNHTGFKRYFKNTSWLFGGQMFQMAVGLFVSVAVARYLGPKDFGLFSYITSIVALVDVIAQLGLSELAKRELVEEPKRRNEIIGTCFSLNVLTGAIFYVAMLFVVALQTNRSLVLGLFALLGSSLLLSSLRFIGLWFQSQVRSDLSVLASSVSTALFAVLKIIAISQGAGLIVFGYIFLFQILTLSALQIYFYSKHFESILNWQVCRQTAVEFLKKSWPLVLSGFAYTVYTRIDQVMLGSILNEEAVGQYSVATRISTIWNFVPVILSTSLFPAILNARKSGRGLYEKRLQNFFDLNAGLAYLITIPLCIVAPWLVLILFGENYQQAGSILAIHALGLPFLFVGVARGRYLVAEKFFKFSMFCTITGASVNLMLNYFLIPEYSGLGAAAATVSSQFITMFLSSFLWHRTREIGFRQFKAYVIFLRIPVLIRSVRIRS